MYYTNWYVIDKEIEYRKQELESVDKQGWGWSRLTGKTSPDPNENTAANPQANADVNVPGNKL